MASGIGDGVCVRVRPDGSGAETQRGNRAIYVQGSGSFKTLRNNTLSEIGKYLDEVLENYLADTYLPTASVRSVLIAKRESLGHFHGHYM